MGKKHGSKHISKNVSREYSQKFIDHAIQQLHLKHLQKVQLETQQRQLLILSALKLLIKLKKSEERQQGIVLRQLKVKQ